jgi:DNA helicase-2/ATP-dependent DNA helicase PcrA
MVVVVGVGSEQFPHRLAEDHEEERRIFHVAITRASERLVLIAPPDPSPYLAEITSPCACLPPLVPWAS